MVRSGFRIDDIDDEDDDPYEFDPYEQCAGCGAAFDQEHEDDCPYAGEEEDDGLGDDTDADEDDPDPEAADFQGLMQMRPEDTVEHLELAGLQAGSFVRGGQVVLPTGPMRCRTCGCTDQVGCEGGCVWAAPNLCSRCVA